MLDLEVQKLIEDGKLKVWLDIDINDTRMSYQRAVDFVGAKNLAYNLSSNWLPELGGSELAPMSTTTALGVALAYAAGGAGACCCATVLKIVPRNVLDRGASMAFVSAFPQEAEYLYPPLTFMQPTGRTETVEVGECSFTVIEVEPRLAAN